MAKYITINRVQMEKHPELAAYLETKPPRKMSAWIVQAMEEKMKREKQRQLRREGK